MHRRYVHPSARPLVLSIPTHVRSVPRRAREPTRMNGASRPVTLKSQGDTKKWGALVRKAPMLPEISREDCGRCSLDADTIS
jgi:hypothetical protein